MECIGASTALIIDVIVGVCPSNRVLSSMPSIALTSIIRVAVMCRVIDRQIECVGTRATIGVGIVVGVGA